MFQCLKKDERKTEKIPVLYYLPINWERVPPFSVSELAGSILTAGEGLALSRQEDWTGDWKETGARPRGPAHSLSSTTAGPGHSKNGELLEGRGRWFLARAQRWRCGH